jgi:hypothetical protein
MTVVDDCLRTDKTSLIPAKAGIQLKTDNFAVLGPCFRADERLTRPNRAEFQIPAYQLKPRSLQ